MTKHIDKFRILKTDPIKTVHFYFLISFNCNIKTSSEHFSFICYYIETEKKQKRMNVSDAIIN